jgi:hypothetical protein
MRHVLVCLACCASVLFPRRLIAQPLEAFLAEAHGEVATVFGFGELSCGSGKKPRRCLKGLKTASGEDFDPDKAQVALALPLKMKMTPRNIWLKLKNGQCTQLRLTDKKSLRIKRKPWDMTPGAVRALGAKPTPYWSARVFLCEPTQALAVNF